MRKTQEKQEPKYGNQAPKPCWEELIEASIEGYARPDVALESYVDELKRGKTP